MTVSYAIWCEDTPAGLSGFDTEAEALAAVRRTIATHGAASIAGWTLVRVPAEGDWQTVAEGTALVELAQSRASGALPNGAVTLVTPATRSS